MYKTPQRLSTVMLLALVLGIALAGCGGGQNEGNAGGSGGEDLTSVKYLTSFGTFGRDAYVYVALDKGFFSDVGLEVDVSPGSGTADVMKLVSAETADFGTGDASTALITEANQDLGLTAIAAVQQRSLAALLALEGSGIENPEDLAGKTLADTPGSTNRILLPFYAERAGFDSESVEFVPASPPDLPKLLASGQADVIGQFVVGEPLIEKAAGGEEAVVLPYSDYLPDLYGNVVMAREDMIENDPDLVKRFVNALTKGLEYSINNPEETAEILTQYHEEQDPEIASEEVSIMADYVSPPDFEGSIGSIDRGRISASIELLEQAGALEGDISAEEFVAAEEVVPGN